MLFISSSIMKNDQTIMTFFPYFLSNFLNKLVLARRVLS